MSEVVSPNFPQGKSSKLISIKSCCVIVNLRHQGLKTKKRSSKFQTNLIILETDFCHAEVRSISV